MTTVTLEQKPDDAAQKVSIGVQVANHLVAYISDHNLQPGDPLPSELNLAEELGVSRTSVREGLTRLQALGLIDSRRKRGMVVQHADLKGVYNMIAYCYASDQERLEELFDARFNTEIGMVDLVVIKATSKDIVEMKELIDKMEECKDIEELFLLDKLLHTALYKATHNSFIESMSAFLDVFYQKTLKTFQKKYSAGNIPQGHFEAAVECHRKMYEALVERDANELRKLIKEHLMDNPLAKRPPYTMYKLNGM
jgi:GntR family transcriptional regulator, transcriptional repressor for pyruvate dehydrogenase complex